MTKQEQLRYEYFIETGVVWIDTNDNIEMEYLKWVENKALTIPVVVKSLPCGDEIWLKAQETDRFLFEEWFDELKQAMFYNGLGMESKLNVIEMRKFKTKEELVEWIETMHLQSTNGRETEEEMFRLGIEAAIEELTEFNLFSIPVVVKSF